MRKAVAICALIFLGTVPLGRQVEALAGTVPSLEELKKSALSQNLTIRTKAQEIKAIAASENIFNHLRLSSSYNFETESSFLGVTFSIPLDFFSKRGKYLRFKELSLEEVKQSVLFELEDLYSKYQIKSKEIEVYEANYKEAELKYRVAQVGFKHNRVTQEELFKAEAEFKKTESDLFKAKAELKAQEERLYEIAGIPRRS